MRMLAIAVALATLLACQSSQGSSDSKCRLQELAIDAALGDAEAQHNLGVEFHRGVNIPQDLSKAAVMWQQSCKGGVVESYNNLGFLTYYGKGIKQDYAEGLRLWRIAAEKGVAESQVHIGEAYSDGEFLRQDYSEAYAWAKTGRHYATRLEDSEIGKSIEEMAEKVLAEARRRLSAAQVTDAEKKAMEYIAAFGPK